MIKLTVKCSLRFNHKLKLFCFPFWKKQMIKENVKQNSGVANRIGSWLLTLTLVFRFLLGRSVYFAVCLNGISVEEMQESLGHAPKTAWGYISPSLYNSQENCRLDLLLKLDIFCLWQTRSSIHPVTWHIHLFPTMQLKSTSADSQIRVQLCSEAAQKHW